MATKKQLAALAKARAARKRNTSKSKSAKNPAKRSIKKVARNDYVLKVETTRGVIGYYVNSEKAPKFDDDINKAFTSTKRAMDNILALLFILKPHGIRSLEVVKK